MRNLILQLTCGACQPRTSTSGWSTAMLLPALPRCQISGQSRETGSRLTFSSGASATNLGVVAEISHQKNTPRNIGALLLLCRDSELSSSSFQPVLMVEISVGHAGF